MMDMSEKGERTMTKLSANDKIRLIDAGAIGKKKVPEFDVGDTVRVNVRIVEDEKTRIQAYEGVVIKKTRGGMSAAFTVRRISYGEGVERTFPLYSPSIDKIVIVKKGTVRRAKLYYLRDKVGKRASRIEEKIGVEGIGEQEAGEQATAAPAAEKPAQE